MRPGPWGRVQPRHSVLGLAVAAIEPTSSAEPKQKKKAPTAEGDWTDPQVQPVAIHQHDQRHKREASPEADANGHLIPQILASLIAAHLVRLPPGTLRPLRPLRPLRDWLTHDRANL